jgi:Heterokaryon incompatibility protein (HET)
MPEIGRQAMIFQHATAACIWLSHTDGDPLSQMIKDITACSEIRPDMPNNAKHLELMENWLQLWLTKILEHLKEILDEPWFTSLWTLQEAYLRPFGLLLSREGSTIAKSGGYSGAENLRSLTSTYLQNC